MADVKEEEITRLQEKDREHDSRLDSLTEHNQAQDFKLKSQMAKDKEHDFRLDSLSNKNSSQDAELHRQSIKDREHDLRCDVLEARCKALEKQVRILLRLLPENVHADLFKDDGLERLMQPKKSMLPMVAVVCAVLALLLSIINLFV